MSQDSLLSVRNLSVTFDIHNKKKWPWSTPAKLCAVNNVSFDLAPGTTLGVVGESGCGKSTLIRSIIGLVKASDGEVIYRGADALKFDKAQRTKFRREVQMIFQDPQSSLNPRMTVGEIMNEPLRQLFPEMSKADREKRSRDMLDRVGILSNAINRYPHEFSGGQCQRIGIARALTTDPKLILCDEPVSALDVSVQAQVVNLLGDIQKETGLSLVFVAHDIGIVHHISDEILVMYLGSLAEQQSADGLLNGAKHPYTKALLSAVPEPDPRAKLEATMLEGDLPSPLKLPRGCVFSTRCPKVHDKCRAERPSVRQIGDVKVACHLDA